MDKSIQNRLHRSGAIDFNVEFATRQADINIANTNPNGKRFWTCNNLGPGNDAISVCEGEPLYHTKRSKGNHYTSIDSSRNPISCLSSLNGYVPGSDSGRKLEECLMQISNTGTPTTDEHKARLIDLYEKCRALFFADMTYCGVAVTKWAYERLGHQQDQFVATMGGLNTVYVDEEVHAGDIIVIDMPYPTEFKRGKLAECDRTHASTCNPWGFVAFQAKKGTPRSKVVLPLRVMPGPEITQTPAVKKAMCKMRDNFMARGQIVGKCVKGAKKGERCDLVLGANAMGCYSYYTRSCSQDA